MYITNISVSIPGEWEVAGPNWQLASVIILAASSKMVPYVMSRLSYLKKDGGCIAAPILSLVCHRVLENIDKKDMPFFQKPSKNWYHTKRKWPAQPSFGMKTTQAIRDLFV